MASGYEQFHKWFWNETIWLPHVITWEELQANRPPEILRLGSLYLCIPVAFMMILLRYMFESYIASPFVKWLGVKDKPIVKVEASPICEKAFKASKQPNHDKIVELSEHLGWSTRQVERWFRQRRIMGQPSVLKKAKECSWRFLFYFFVTSYATFVLSKYGCLFDTKQCFIGFKTHILAWDVYIYYLAEVGMYISLSISQFTDVKRKDFWQNLIHHLATLALLTYAYVGGFYHIGSLIVYVHDVSDVFLEAAKVFHYAKKQKLCDACFVVFAIVFYISRFYVLPFRVIYECVADRPWYIGNFFFYRVMLAFLTLLQVLHTYWAYCVGIIVYKALIGKGVTDSRSDEEDVSGGEMKNAEVPLENKKKT